MDMKIINTNPRKRTSEIWLLCTGGHDRIEPEFVEFSKEKRIKVIKYNNVRFFQLIEFSNLDFYFFINKAKRWRCFFAC